MEKQARQMRYPYLNQWGADYAQPLALPYLTFFVITPLDVNGSLKGAKNLTCSINLQFSALLYVSY